MMLSRFEPLNWIGALHNDPRRALAYQRTAADKRQATEWTPAVDIVEEEDRYVLCADLPGVAAEDIAVDMEEHVLSISGGRKFDTADSAQKLQLRERASGEFRRRFTLPEAVDADGISARYELGTLEISIPKKAVATARKITVKAA